MGVLFDLDQTLIDSRRAEPLRTARRWAEVYRLIPELQPYDGISDLLAELHARQMPICIVTSSPRPYCTRVIANWGWPIDATVCYHDTSRRKPHPDPILAALARLGIDAAGAVAVGDDPRDVAAARTAGVYSIGVLWGAANPQALLRSQPDRVCETVDDLRRSLLARFAI